MKEIQIGDTFWTWVTPPDRADAPLVKRIVIKDIFTVMVTVDLNGSAGWSIDVPKEKLYDTQEEAIEALQRELDKNMK